MADLNEITEELREDGGEDSGLETGGGSINGETKKRRRSRKRRNTGGLERSGQGSPLGRDLDERRKQNEDRAQNDGQKVDSQRPVNLTSTQGGHRARFFEDYRKEAEEYDKEFMKKYDEDLNTTLIFAGLFSAVTSAFILDVQSQLQPDTGDETAALLRVLIYKIDNTTFGNDPPTLPQWSGPPHMIVQVQAILYASLAASLLSAFLAMLGKQWLNQYSSTDMRGTAIDRSQNRQRKLDGIVTWYFDYVMESLPLMLQVALLLLGCALSRYLWGINVTVASVVIGVTSSGIALYIFILLAGAASESCPYQTPGSHALRYLAPKVQKILHSTPSTISSVVASAIRNTFRESKAIRTIGIHVEHYHPWWTRGKIGPFLKDMVVELPRALAIDVYHLGRVMIRSLITSGSAIIWLFTGFVRRAYNTSPTLQQALDQQTIELDLRCILWMLRTSLDKAVRLSSLKHLVAMAVLADFDPTLVADCFAIFTGCINVNNGGVVITHESEELATASATCFLRTFHHLSITDPTSGVLADLRQQYNRIFLFGPDFRDLPFYYTMAKIHDLVNRPIQWGNYRPSARGHILAARDIAQAAQVEYQNTQHQNVPEWTLHFSFRSLSLDPLPPPHVIADCLSIIAIDLGCDISNTGAATLDERTRVEQVSNLITRELKTMTEAENRVPLQLKRKAITTLLPYAVWQERDGQPEMFNTILHAAGASKMSEFMWYHIIEFVSTLFSDASPRAAILASPHLPWYRLTDRRDLVQWWTAMASVVPHTEEVAQGVVDTLLQIASYPGLLQHITPEAWSWLTLQPSLPPVCTGRHCGTSRPVVKAVRALKDLEVLKSYFLLVWSEWDRLYYAGLDEMCTSILEDFGGIWMGQHRTDLIQRLDHVLGQLDRGLEYLTQHNPDITEENLQRRKDQYQKLRDILLEMDTEVISRSRAVFMCALPLSCP